MDISVSSVIGMLSKIAELRDNEVAANVLIVARGLADPAEQREVVQAVADGLGVSLV